MQSVLEHIKSVDGVIGCALFDNGGKVIAQAFPPLLADGDIKEAASLVHECLDKLRAVGRLEMMEMRYAEGRIIMKAFSGGLLYLLCTKNANQQLLLLTLAMAVRRLDALVSKPQDNHWQEAEVITETASNSETRCLCLQIGKPENREAATSLDSLGMIAVSRTTAAAIEEFYGTPLKKIRLTNRLTAESGLYPVMIMNNFTPQQEEMVIIGPKVEKKLHLSEGDAAEVRTE